LTLGFFQDMETFDLEDFKYNSVNMTSFRLVDADSNRVRETLRQMERFQPLGTALVNGSGIIQAEPALLYDAVHVLATALAKLDTPLSVSLQQCIILGRS